MLPLTRRLHARLSLPTCLQDDEEACAAAHEALCKEIALQDFAGSKYGSSARALRRECGVYASQEATLQADIAATKEEIEVLKRGLADARAQRARNEQYDALRGAAAAHPPRHETTARIDEITADVKALEKQAAEADGRMEMRKKQFVLLLQVADELTQELRDAEEKAAAVKGEWDGVASDGEDDEEGALPEEGEMDIDR